MNRALPNAHTRALDIAQAAWAAERCGQFEAGLLEYSDQWALPDYLPSTEGLTSSLGAELKLRFASLLGYQGHFKKIKDSQLRARDILTGTLSVFEELGNAEKSAECENHIALTYSRTGEFAEARAWLTAAMGRPLPSNNIHRLATITYEMLIDIAEHQYDGIIRLYSKHESTVRAWADDWIGANFYINAGVGLLESGSHDDALDAYELARYRAERSSIWTTLGSIENERAIVFRGLGRFAKAHRAVDHGAQVYRSIGDMSREGMLLDTKASIFLAEGSYVEALRTVERAIGILKDGENKSFLAEAFATEAKILVWLDNFSAAVTALFEAVQLARTYSGNRFAKSLISQFEETVKEKNGAVRPGRSRPLGLEWGELELVLPPSLAGHERFRGIWINNDHLEFVGLKRESLAIAADIPVKRGDLAALCEIDSGEIFCGFYDSEFGVVCLEGCDSVPQLFDEGSVKLIGKIIGKAGSPDEHGKRVVSPIGNRNSLSEF
jgi:tetratricopeptide (TPR) repeat protein